MGMQSSKDVALKALKVHAVGIMADMYSQGYITSMDGNACFKFDERFFVTPTSIPKQHMSTDMIVEVDGLGEVIESPSGLKPSIETPAHLSALFCSSKAFSIHVHSPKTVALFSAVNNNYPHLVERLERKMMTEWPELHRYTKLGKTIPFQTPGSVALHQSVEDSFLPESSLNPPDISVMIRHGVFAVGDSFFECQSHIERLEHISGVILEMMKVTSIESVLI
ncbi:MAG TPA: class II aldolase/adducin family protein [Fervidobacterium sp.]|nr:class II aldolase/adducin family protein [Fervidobacterium sp.]